MNATQRVRILLARLLARENGRPVSVDLLLHEASKESIPPAQAADALARLAEEGAAMRVPEGWIPRAPRLPEDVTDERAARMRLYAGDRRG